MNADTVFLRLEGPRQCYAIGKDLLIGSSRVPTQSAVVGMILAAFGVRRREAREAIAALGPLEVGVRTDRAPVVSADFQFARPSEFMLADGGRREEGCYNLREYLCDASFLVAVRARPAQVEEIARALANPCFPLYLGKRSCPVGDEGVIAGFGRHAIMEDALAAVPAVGGDATTRPAVVTRCRPGRHTRQILDVLVSLDPLVHAARHVEDIEVPVQPVAQPARERRRRPDNRGPMARRLVMDGYLCVRCGMRATEVHHGTYARYPTATEELGDLSSLCGMCHPAGTSIEYDAGMRETRVDHADPAWLPAITARLERD